MNKTLSLTKEKIKVLLLEGIHPLAQQIFQENGYSSIEQFPSTLDVSKLSEIIQDVFILGIRFKTRISAEILRNENRLIAT
jgi:D-3-phosphoglycerate dehydrogenase